MLVEALQGRIGQRGGGRWRGQVAGHAARKHCFTGARSTGHHDKTLAFSKREIEILSGAPVTSVAEAEIRLWCEPEGIADELIETLVH